MVNGIDHIVSDITCTVLSTNKFYWIFICCFISESIIQPSRSFVLYKYYDICKQSFKSPGFSAGLALSRIFYISGFIIMAFIGDLIPIHVIAMCMAGLVILAGLMNNLLLLKEKQQDESKREMHSL